jgi:hypothetical protein
VSINVYLYSGSGVDVYLRPSQSRSIDVYLFANAGNATDVYLRPEGRPVLGGAAAPSFPTQYFGLKFYDGTVKDLCLVAIADAPAGNMLVVRKGGTNYAAYLVDTSDGNASKIRIKTSSGTKAIRLKT